MGQKKAKAICIPLKEAESVRRFLRDQNLLRSECTILKEGEYIYFPIKEVTEDLRSYTVVTKIFEKKETRPRSYKDIVKIPKKIKEELPTSYDVIGDIILLKLPLGLRPYQKEIGNALLTCHSNIRTVCLIDPVAGELRTRTLSIIAGEKRTTTIHTEYGLSFHVDVKIAYFSPRLASERKRVASLVKSGEIVVDMFAGVAPFSIMIARYAKPKMVYAIDKNNEAVILAKQNVKQNLVVDKVEVIHADAKEVEKIVPEKADRIIMNLPFSAHDFFSSALRIAAKRCIVHYYDILSEEEIAERIDELKKISLEQGFCLTDLSIRKMKTYAPREFYIGIDITATKHADVA